MKISLWASAFALGLAGSLNAVVGTVPTPPGGLNSYIQYNQRGSFAGSSLLTYSTTTLTISVTSMTASGTIIAGFFQGDGSRLTNLPSSGGGTVLGFRTVFSTNVATTKGADTVHPLFISTGSLQPGTTAFPNFLFVTELSSFTGLVHISSNLVVQSTMNYPIPLQVGPGGIAPGSAFVTALFQDIRNSAGVSRVVIKNALDGGELVLGVTQRASHVGTFNRFPLEVRVNDNPTIQIDTGTNSGHPLFQAPFVTIDGRLYLNNTLAFPAPDGIPTSTLDVNNGSVTIRGTNSGLTVTGLANNPTIGTDAGGNFVPGTATSGLFTSSVAINYPYGTTGDNGMLVVRSTGLDIPVFRILYSSAPGGNVRTAMLFAEGSSPGTSHLDLVGADGTVNVRFFGDYISSSSHFIRSGSLALGNTISPTSRLDVLNGSITIRGQDAGLYLAGVSSASMNALDIRGSTICFQNLNCYVYPSTGGVAGQKLGINSVATVGAYSYHYLTFGGDGGGGGIVSGGSSLAVGTGSAVATNIISSPTFVLNFDSTTFLVKLTADVTAYVSLNSLVALLSSTQTWPAMQKFSSVTVGGNMVVVGSASIRGVLVTTHTLVAPIAYIKEVVAENNDQNNPQYHFAGSRGTGFYSTVGDPTTIGMVAQGGFIVLTMASDGLTMGSHATRDVQIFASGANSVGAGAPLAPGYSFRSQPQAGLFHDADLVGGETGFGAAVAQNEIMRWRSGGVSIGRKPPSASLTVGTITANGALIEASSDTLKFGVTGHDWTLGPATGSIGGIRYIFQSTPTSANTDQILHRMGNSSSTYWGGDNVGVAAAGGGGASSLAVATGSIQAANEISSPTAILNFSSGPFLVKLTGGATGFVSLDYSSVTVEGPFRSAFHLFTSTSSNRIDEIQADVSTHSLRIDEIQVDLTTTSTRIDELQANLSTHSARIDELQVDLTTTSVDIDGLFTSANSTYNAFVTYRSTVSSYLTGGALAIYDEGAVQGNITTLNITGGGAITVSGSTGTLDIAAAAGGGASSLAVGTGSVQAMNIISSPTANISFSSGPFKVRLTGGATAYVDIDYSSITAQGFITPGSGGGGNGLSVSTGSAQAAGTAISSPAAVIVLSSASFNLRSPGSGATVYIEIGTNTAKDFGRAAVIRFSTPTGTAFWDTPKPREFYWNGASLLALSTGNSSNIAPIVKTTGTVRELMASMYPSSACRGGNFFVPSYSDEFSTPTFTAIWFTTNPVAGNVVWNVKYTTGIASGESWDVVMTTVVAPPAANNTGGKFKTTVTSWQPAGVGGITGRGTLSSLGWDRDDMVCFLVCREQNTPSDGDTLRGPLPFLMGFEISIPQR